MHLKIKIGKQFNFELQTVGVTHVNKTKQNYFKIIWELFSHRFRNLFKINKNSLNYILIVV